MKPPRDIDKPSNVLHKGQAFSLEETPGFAQWLAALRDRKAKAMIADRIKRAGNGNFGKVRSVQGGVFELRGERFYFVCREAVGDQQQHPSARRATHRRQAQVH